MKNTLIVILCLFATTALSGEFDKNFSDFVDDRMGEEKAASLTSAKPKTQPKASVAVAKPETAKSIRKRIENRVKDMRDIYNPKVVSNCLVAGWDGTFIINPQHIVFVNSIEKTEDGGWKFKIMTTTQEWNFIAKKHEHELIKKKHKEVVTTLSYYLQHGHGK